MDWRFGTVLRGRHAGSPPDYTVMVLGRWESSHGMTLGDECYVMRGDWYGVGLAIDDEIETSSAYPVGETAWIATEGDWDWEVIEP